MKCLRCKFCRGEVEIIGNDRAINKKIKCIKCGYTNVGEADTSKKTEVIIMRKRSSSL